MRNIKLFVAVALLFSCKAGDCSCGPVDEYARCASACTPRAMKSFHPNNGGCEPSECVCEDLPPAAAPAPSASK